MSFSFVTLRAKRRTLGRGDNRLLTSEKLRSAGSDHGLSTVGAGVLCLVIGVLQPLPKLGLWHPVEGLIKGMYARKWNNFNK